MSSDSHSDDHSHSTSHGDDHGNDSHGHAPAADIIPDTSWQDWMLKGVTVVAAGLLYFMAFSWMGVPLPEASHEAGPEHASEHSSESGAEAGASEHGSEHNEEHH